MQSMLEKWLLVLSYILKLVISIVDFLHFLCPICKGCCNGELINEYVDQGQLERMHILLNHEVVLYEQINVDFCLCNQILKCNIKLTDRLVVLLYDDL